MSCYFEFSVFAKNLLPRELEEGLSDVIAFPLAYLQLSQTSLLLFVRLPASKYHKHRFFRSGGFFTILSFAMGCNAPKLSIYKVTNEYNRTRIETRYLDVIFRRKS